MIRQGGGGKIIGAAGTAMWDLIGEQMGKYLGNEKGEALKQFSELIALGCVDTPDDVASFVSYLAPRGSDYMTGQSVMIDGGIIFSYEAAPKGSGASTYK
jgi:meso-butanediol dehydrogenase/(S,S)-butanediol dehydrogenase/diacetyl reductase